MTDVQSAYAQARAEGMSHTVAIRLVAEDFELEPIEAWRQVFADEDENERP